MTIFAVKCNMGNMKTLSYLCICTAIAVMTAACGKQTADDNVRKTEVEAYAVVPFDSIGITDEQEFADVLPLRYSYTPREAEKVDTLLVRNDSLLNAKHYIYQWISYTDPERLELVIMPDKPLLRQKVEITAVDTIPEYGIVQFSFRFNDKKEWEEITAANIGRRIAIFVNGKLLNAPQVNMPITQGACAVTVPLDEAAEMLPK